MRNLFGTGSSREAGWSKTENSMLKRAQGIRRSAGESPGEILS